MMPDEPQSKHFYSIYAGKVVVAKEILGGIHATGDITVISPDTQTINFDYLITKSANQTRRLLDEMQLSGRYSLEVYESRPEIEQHIKRFLSSSKAGLFISGESGVGKSNLLTHLCQQLRADRQVVLFYAGSDFFDDLNVEQRVLKDCGCIHLSLPFVPE